jgi:crotonobetainyl-CoA:carnitine CoA-transferase CaiB-like acyl-CoA transferase
MSGVFDGIRVIDATHVLAGPFASYQLAVLGADVIKVESPEALDEARFFGGSDQNLEDRAMGTQYLVQGSNKRAILLDLQQSDGIEAFKRLVRTADVLIENFRTGAFEELGLDYDALRKINPRLIYTSISGFGRSGPLANFKAYDQVVQASSGIMSATGTRETGPLKVGAPVLDYGTGLCAAFAISAALYDRGRTGKGQKIDVAMSAVAMMFQAPRVVRYLRDGVSPMPRGNDGALASTCCYQTEMGLLIVAAGNLRLRKRLWSLLGRPELNQPTYALSLAAMDEERSVLASIFLNKTALEWEKYLQSHGIPAAAVRSFAQAVDEPHTHQRGVLRRFDNFLESGRSLSVPVAAFLFEHDGPEVNSIPPTPGEHTKEILLELGYSEAEIQEKYVNWQS